MQQALYRSSLVPHGFVVERAYHEGDRAVIEVRPPEASVCVHRAEQFPDVSIAGIGDA
jgi:hypothetical protein